MKAKQRAASSGDKPQRHRGPKKIATYLHPQTRSAQEPDTAPGPYYVSVRRSDGKTLFLSGPYAAHPEALALVNKAKSIAYELDVRAVWYSYGTIRCKPDCLVPGALQCLGYSLDLSTTNTPAQNS